MAKSMWVTYGAIPIASRLVSIAAAILVTPFLRDMLGGISFGLWETLIGVTLLAGVVQLAVNNTASFFAAKTSEGNRNEWISRIVGVCWTFNILCLLVFMPLSFFSGEILINALNIPRKFADVIHISLPVVTFTSIIQIQAQCYLGILNGLGYIGRSTIMYGFWQSVIYIAAVIAVANGYGLYAFPIAIAISCGMTLLASNFLLASSVAGTCFLPCIPKVVELREAIRYAGFLIASNSIGVGRTTLDRVLIARTDLVLAGSFGLAQRLVSLIIVTVSAVSNPLSAKITRMKEELGQDGVLQFHHKVTIVISMVAGLLGCSLILFRSPILTLWLGADQYTVHIFMLIGIFGAVTALTFAGPAVIISKGLGRPDMETRYAVVSVLLLLILKPGGMYFGGLVGGVLATALSWGLSAIYMQRMASSLIQNSHTTNKFQYIIYSVSLFCGCLSYVLGAMINWPDTRMNSFSLLFGFALSTLILGTMFLKHLKSLIIKSFLPRDKEETIKPSLSGKAA